MTDELLEKYDQIKEFISEDEFLNEMNKLKKENQELRKAVKSWNENSIW